LDTSAATQPSTQRHVPADLNIKIKGRVNSGNPFKIFHAPIFNLKPEFGKLIYISLEAFASHPMERIYVYEEGI
jgi:hypothetical protein